MIPHVLHSITALKHHLPAVDLQQLPGDIARSRTTQESHQGSDLFRVALAAHGNHRIEIREQPRTFQCACNQYKP